MAGCQHGNPYTNHPVYWVGKGDYQKKKVHLIIEENGRKIQRMA